MAGSVLARVSSRSTARTAARAQLAGDWLGGGRRVAALHCVAWIGEWFSCGQEPWRAVRYRAPDADGHADSQADGHSHTAAQLALDHPKSHRPELQQYQDGEGDAEESWQWR